MNGTLLPMVSVVIPTYEQDAVIKAAVDSALAQDYPNFEVLVVDDASPRSRYDEVRAIQDPRLRFVRNERNLGRTENYRHAALHLACGDWMVNLDGDDHFSDHSFLSAAMERVQEDPEVVMVSARCTIRHSSGDTVSPGPGNVTMCGGDVVLQLPRPNLLFMHLSTVYRRDLACRIDMYRSSAISSDWESLYRLALQGRVAFLDRVVGVWVLHGQNISGSADWRALAENLEIWPAVFNAAREAGLDTGGCRRAEDRCLAHFGALQMPSASRAGPPWSVLHYLVSLGRLSMPALLAVLSRPANLLRLAAGLAGYYRMREF